MNPWTVVNPTTGNEYRELSKWPKATEETELICDCGNDKWGAAGRMVGDILKKEGVYVWLPVDSHCPALLSTYHTMSCHRFIGLCQLWLIKVNGIKQNVAIPISSLSRSVSAVQTCHHVQPLFHLTREQQDQADGEEVRVLSQTGRVHAEVGLTEHLDVSSDHFIERAAPSPGY